MIIFHLAAAQKDREMWSQVWIWPLTFMLARGMHLDGWDELISVAPFMSLDLLFEEVDDAGRQDCADRAVGGKNNAAGAINRPIRPESHLIVDELNWNHPDAHSALLDLNEENHAGLIPPNPSSSVEQAGPIWTHSHEGQPNFGPGESDPGRLWLYSGKCHHLDFGVSCPNQGTTGASIVTHSRPGHAMANRTGKYEFRGSAMKASTSVDDFFHGCTWGVSIQDQLERDESNPSPRVLERPLHGTSASDDNLGQEMACGTWHLGILAEGRQSPEQFKNDVEAMQTSYLPTKNALLSFEEALASREATPSCVGHDRETESLPRRKFHEESESTTIGSKGPQASAQHGQWHNDSTKTHYFERETPVGEAWAYGHAPQSNFFHSDSGWVQFFASNQKPHVQGATGIMDSILNDKTVDTARESDRSKLESFILGNGYLKNIEAEERKVSTSSAHLQEQLEGTKSSQNPEGEERLTCTGFTAADGYMKMGNTSGYWPFSNLSEVHKMTAPAQEFDVVEDKALSEEKGHSAEVGSWTQPVKSLSLINVEDKGAKSPGKSTKRKVDFIAGSEKSLGNKLADKALSPGFRPARSLSQSPLETETPKSSCLPKEIVKKTHPNPMVAALKEALFPNKSIPGNIGKKRNGEFPQEQSNVNIRVRGKNKAHKILPLSDISDDYTHFIDLCRGSIREDHIKIASFDLELFKKFKLPKRKYQESTAVTQSRYEVFLQNIHGILESHNKDQKLCFDEKMDLHLIKKYRGFFLHTSRMKKKNNLKENTKKYRTDEQHGSRDWMVQGSVNNMVNDSTYVNGMYTEQIKSEIGPFIEKLTNTIKSRVTTKGKELYVKRVKEILNIFIFYVEMITSVIPKQAKYSSDIRSEAGWQVNEAWKVFKLVQAKLLVPHLMIGVELDGNNLKMNFEEQIACAFWYPKISSRRKMTISWYLVIIWMSNCRPGLFFAVRSGESFKLTPPFKQFFNDMFIYSIKTLQLEHHQGNKTQRS